MRIAFVIPSLGFGGAERVISVLSNHFAQSEEVYIITTGRPGSVAYSIDERVEIISAFDESIFKTWRNVRAFCRQKKIDVALAFMSETGTMTALSLAFARTKVITSERNDPRIEKAEKSRAIRMLERIAKYFTAGYVFQSEGARDYYPKLCQKKSEIILNPLDCSRLPEREEAQIDNRIVSVGRLQPQKNQKMLIDAFAKSKAKEVYTLHIYGEGALRPALEEQIASRGLTERVFLEGNSKTVHEDIKNARLFAFTSDHEGLPNALIEAMAMGIPCISTDCSPGGARMLIDDGENGRLVACGDVDAFAAALDDTLFDAEKQSAYGRNAKRIRDRVDTKKIADEWLCFIKRAMKKA